MYYYSMSENAFFTPSVHLSIPPDAIEITDAGHAYLLAGISDGRVIVQDEHGCPVLADSPPPSTEQIINDYERALDSHLDAVAKSCRYDNRFTFALRAGYPGPYHDEAVRFAAWMDSCNVRSYALLASVVSGHADLPTISEFIDGLPRFNSELS